MKEKKDPAERANYTLAPILHEPSEPVTLLCLWYLRTSCPG